MVCLMFKNLMISLVIQSSCSATSIYILHLICCDFNYYNHNNRQKIQIFLINWLGQKADNKTNALCITIEASLKQVFPDRLKERCNVFYYSLGRRNKTIVFCLPGCNLPAALTYCPQQKHLPLSWAIRIHTARSQGHFPIPHLSISSND